MIQALFLFNFSSGKLLFLPTLKTFQINAAGVQTHPESGAQKESLG